MSGGKAVQQVKRKNFVVGDRQYLHSMCTARYVMLPCALNLVPRFRWNLASKY